MLNLPATRTVLINTYFAFTTLTSSGATTFTASTASSSSTTGAVIVTGGVGVGGSIYGAGAAISTLDGFNIDGGTY